MPPRRSDKLLIANATENNLKNVDLDVPHDTFVAITGISGSGKSSLAFDTIYAEGQRRYIETFSPYTRQFFDKVKRPAVDHISNVRPAIAIQQRTRILNSRSTVGSMTDINDYLKIIWSNLAKPYCSECGEELRGWDARSVHRDVEALLESDFEAKLLVCADLPYASKKARKVVLDRLSMLGYSRILHHGEVVNLDDGVPVLSDRGTVTVVMDRLSAKSLHTKGAFDSLTQAFVLGEGRLSIVESSGSKAPRFYSITPRCERHEFSVSRAYPALFSYNHPLGACPTCNGFGRILQVDPSRCVPNEHKSIEDFAIGCWSGPSCRYEHRQLLGFCKVHSIETRVPWSSLPLEAKELLFNHKSKQFTGVRPWFTWLEKKAYKMHVRVFLASFRTQAECPECKGARLKADALAYQILGKTIHDLNVMPIEELEPWFGRLEEALGTIPRQLKDVFSNVKSRIHYLNRLGLPYLTLDRQARTLSGGETQRVNLVAALGSNLISTHFVLDEPSVGLHARDGEKLLEALKELTGRGNSLCVVEHDPDLLHAADHIVELGPDAGEHGGAVVYSGPRENWEGVHSAPFAAARFAPEFSKVLRIRNASARNLRVTDVEIPLGSFVCITGVSGSGKSTLVHEIINRAAELHAQFKEPRPDSINTGEGVVEGLGLVSQVALVDQSPLAKSPRANIATYSKIWEEVRGWLASTEEARARALSKSSFSFNVSAGRCTACEGAGFIREDMQFLSDVFIPCETCLGKRFQAPVLEVKYKGKNVHDFLNMTINAAHEFFPEGSKVRATTAILKQLGLGHSTLGHPLSELSGGEAQRLKLVPFIQQGDKGPSLLIFDEPTTGLHIRDVERLIELFQSLVEQGHSVLCVEHNLRLIASADWLIDLGPEGGDKGGEIVATDTPHQFLKMRANRSYTATYLKRFVDDFSEGNVPARAIGSVRRAARKLPSHLTIRGAREHNLKNITVSVPLDKIVTFTGVSGSGKSSIAKDIIYAEGQRRYLDCLSPYARQFIKELKRPDIDAIAHVKPTICVYQHTFQPSSLSTVGTMSEVCNFLRLLFAKVGTQYCPDHPDTPISPMSAEKIADELKSEWNEPVRILAPVLNQRKGNHRTTFERAVELEISEVRVDGAFGSPSDHLLGLKKTKTHTIEFVVGRLNPKNIDAQALREGIEQALALGGGTVIVVSKARESVYSSERTCSICKTGFFAPDPEDLSFHSKRGKCEQCEGTGYEDDDLCSECGGSRLGPVGRNIRLNRKAIHELCLLKPPALQKFVKDLSFTQRERVIVEPVVRELDAKLYTLIDLGLDYIELGRDCLTLSGGELQRLRLGTAMGSPLSGVMYIFDEPSASLHPKDVRKIISKFVELRDRGNSVILIEHDTVCIANSDYIIEVGPAAGKNGGEIVCEGTFQELLSNSKSLTAIEFGTVECSTQRPLLTEGNDTKIPALTVFAKAKNNIRNISVDVPLRQLVCVAGVSGSGKSSLVFGIIAETLLDFNPGASSWTRPNVKITSDLPIDRLVIVDQKPIGANSRSTPASYLGVWDEIRKLFATTLEAKSRGWNQSFFSYNTGKGRCQTCKGLGELKLEMSFLAEAKIPCEMCRGARFSLDADSVKYLGHSVSDVLKLSFDEARKLFINHRKIHQILKYSCELGLGYLTLGQPSSTLSGGESQRIKLVSELSVRRAGHSLYILDEPTTGLHRLDTQQLLLSLRQLVEQGNSVVIIEHDIDVVSQVDTVIEMGPGPGEAGGTVIFKGTPTELEAASTPWGEILRGRIESPKRRVAAHEG